VSVGLTLLSQNHIVHLVNVFIRAGTSRSAAALTSVHCARVSVLLEQPVNATCRPFFVRNFRLNFGIGIGKYTYIAHLTIKNRL